MTRFLHDLIFDSAARRAAATALVSGRQRLDYETLAGHVASLARGLAAQGMRRRDRVAIYLDKRPETVLAIFATAAAGGIFVPVNPVLKAPQVAHVLKDSGARFLISSRSRIAALGDVLAGLADLAVISVDGDDAGTAWSDLLDGDGPAPEGPRVDNDVAAIFYTSGSTGKPKGVVLSHRNLVVGATSVAQYIGNSAEDRILALLPLSFDAGFSQLTTGFAAGATVVLHNYLLARDIPRIVAREGITGLTCVPPLWMQLAGVSWEDGVGAGLRYFANTGGHMPRALLGRLRACFPNAKPYLMYGLTEAFRSTYLDPAEVDRRPDSIGKAIPNAEILVVKPDGSLAGPGEEGELVHRGPLVGLGYWNDRERTAERYRPVPGALEEVPTTELAVWSGDIVRLDEEGFLYFVGRNDDMIKTSGYRVSPAEVEEVLYDSGQVKEAAAIGLPHTELGQEIVVAIVPEQETVDCDALIARCRERLPGFMVPGRLEIRESLPRSANGKIDRKAIKAALLAAAEKEQATA
ncbi:MAG: acyl-CoA ligase (AMP-forming), exosortase A system-associated [Alphaproteobacteria bacterium]|nr:MAG: acyl-CoA ligase (AMP-forming), exosortase A system-associated [Alphaproteobacteria bacterium]